MSDDITLYASPEPTEITPYGMDEFVDELLESLDRAPRTVEAYRKGVRYFMDWTQEQGIAKPTRADIKRYKDHLMQTYKVSTAASYLAAVRWLYRAIGEESGRPELNIAVGIRTPRVAEGHKKDPMTADQAKTVLSSMPTGTLAQKRDRAIISLILHMGLRVVEVSRADVGDIRNTAKGPVLAIWGKARDGKDEIRPIHPNALDAVNDYLKARSKDGSLKDTDPLFASVSRRNYGQRMNVRSISRICKQTLKDYVLDSPRLTAHSYRYTAINLLIENGASLYEAQQFARHRDPKTTEVYIHESETTLQDAANRLGAALSL